MISRPQINLREHCGYPSADPADHLSSIVDTYSLWSAYSTDDNRHTSSRVQVLPKVMHSVRLTSSQESLLFASST